MAKLLQSCVRRSRSLTSDFYNTAHHALGENAAEKQYRDCRN